MWPVAAVLKYTTVVYDQRLAGRSPCFDKDFTVEAHLRDLETIRTGLNAEKVHLFGHS